MNADRNKKIKNKKKKKNVHRNSKGGPCFRVYIFFRYSFNRKWVVWNRAILRENISQLSKDFFKRKDA